MHHVIPGHNGCKALRQLEPIEIENSTAGTRGCGHTLAYAITVQMIKELNHPGGRSYVECGLPENLILFASRTQISGPPRDRRPGNVAKCLRASCPRG